MYHLSHLVKETVPNYLAGLPIPETIGGWFKLGVKDWLALIPPTAVLAGITYASYRVIYPQEESTNSSAQKNTKRIFCRCRRTKNFPWCDGSHNIKPETK